MPLKTFIVAVASDMEGDENLITDKDLAEAMREYLGIPNENTQVQIHNVQLRSQGYDEGICRRCGQDCEEERLFCNDCSDEMVEGTAEEEEEMEDR